MEFILGTESSGERSEDRARRPCTTKCVSEGVRNGSLRSTSSSLECITRVLCNVSIWSNCIYHVSSFTCKPKIVKEILVYITQQSQVNRTGRSRQRNFRFFSFEGNCEIADLLMRAAERINLRLDQVVNRDGSIDERRSDFHSD